MSTSDNNLSNYNSLNVPNGSGLKFALIVSEWNSEITEKLYEGAFKTLIENGVFKKDIKRYNVPGSYELVYASKIMQNKNFNVVIVLGSVIKGETRHFDFICQAVASGISHLNAIGDCPIIFCVLTDDNISQARDRSGGRYGNKGVEAAVSALKMARLI